MSKSRRVRARERALAAAGTSTTSAAVDAAATGSRAVEAAAGGGKPSTYTRATSTSPLEAALLQRMSLLNGTGMTFDGSRDLYSALGYKKTLTIVDFRGRVQRNGIAAQVVEAMPKSCWRGHGVLVEDATVDVTTPFEAAWETFSKRVPAWSWFEKSDISAGMGKWAVVLIGAPGHLEDEMPRCTIEQIVYLAVYEEDQAKIETEDIDYNTESPTFGQPKFYSVNLPAASGGSGFRKVHASRIIHVADNTTSNPLVGESRLLRCWNYLDDLDKMMGATGEATWQLANQGYQFDIDSDAQIDPEEEAGMRLQMDQFMHNQRRYMRTRKVKVNTFGSDVEDTSNNIDTCLSLIAGSARIPKRILLGSESGELASSQDKHNWDRRVMDRRESFCETVIVRPLVDRLIKYGALPEPKEYVVEWPEVADMTIVEKSAVALQWAQMNRDAGEVVVTGAEIRDKVLGLEPLNEQPAPAPIGTVAGQFNNVDRSNPTPPWKDVHTVADKHIDSIRSEVASCLNSGRKGVDVAGLTDSFERGDREHADWLAMQAVDATEEAMQRRVVDPLVTCMVAGAGAAAERAGRSGGFLLRSAAKKKKTPPIDVGLQFDAQHPRARAWAEEHAAAMVVDIAEGSREAIRNIITAAFVDGIEPRVAARQIAEVIGLTVRDASAVVGLRAKLEAASPGSLVKAGNVRIRVPLEGMTEEVINLRVSQYAGRLLRARAMNIARTETLAAANAGQTELWRQAEANGLLKPGATRVWLVTPDDRLCPECVQMDGQVRGLNEPFQDPTGAGIDGPPLHPSCRCATGLNHA